VENVDCAKRTITIGRPFKDCMPLAMETITLSPMLIEDVKVLKMPVGETSSPDASSVAKSTPTTTTDEQPAKHASVSGERISVSELFVSALVQPKNKNSRQRISRTKGHQYKDFGEFKLFQGQQIPTPRILEVNVHSSSQGPSGIPLVDCSNGYSRFLDTEADLSDPIDFNVLDKDFDFDGNLALFNKEKFLDSANADEKDGNSPILVKSFRNDENVLNDSSRLVSWTQDSSAKSSKSSNVEFRGCLVSVDCGEKGKYKGKVLNVDSAKRTITIDRPFKDDLPMDEKTLTLFSSSMRDLKVLKVPSNENVPRVM